MACTFVSLYAGKSDIILNGLNGFDMTDIPFIGIFVYDEPNDILEISPRLINS